MPDVFTLLDPDLVAAILAWALAVLFAAGAALNWIAPLAIRQSYARWRYPDWFHYVTAMLELAAAVLLAVASTRSLGVALAALIMAAATLTLLRHREFGHAVLPALVLALALLCGALLS